MHEAEVPVTLQPLGKTVYVLKGTRFLESAILAGVSLDYPCGGEGTCGKCRVVVRQGACPAEPAERRVLTEEELQAGYRLACQMRVGAAMTVEIPRTSLLGSHCQILTRSETVPQSGTDPAIRKQYMELLPPDRGRDESDLARIQRVAGPCDADLATLRQLPRRLRDAHFHGTAVLADNRLIDFEPGNTERDAYAVAMDIGTTTLVAALVELHSGCELAVAARLNPQTRFGDDVLSRILHSQQADGLEELQGAVLGAVREMIGEVAAEGQIPCERIYEVTFAGNTTMQQLLLGIDPRHLGEVPFVPVTSDRLLVPAADLGLQIHPLGRAYVLPVIGGFVGGDTVAGIVSTGLVDFPGPTLLVDIGTNGEIVLWANGKLSAASTAAGPAFEGARISQGMRAAPGRSRKWSSMDACAST